MKDRCHNKHSKEYHNYGERGIAVCDEWRNNFQAFYNWVISNGYKEGLQIDRIDVNGNYEPSNCRWSTPKKNSNNKRNNRYITIGNRTHTLSEWCNILGLKYSTVSVRLFRGWTVIKALELGDEYEINMYK